MYSVNLAGCRKSTDEGIDQLLVEFAQSVQMAVPIGRWFEIRQLVRRISAEQFIEQGLSGQALGDTIYAERLSVLSTEISAGYRSRLVKPTRDFSYSVISQDDF